MNRRLLLTAAATTAGVGLALLTTAGMRLAGAMSTQDLMGPLLLVLLVTYAGTTALGRVGGAA